MFVKDLIFFLFLCFALFSNVHAQTVRVAVYNEPPFAEYKDGQFTGENIELARLFADSINADVVFLACPFVRCMSLVKKGEADMIFGVKRTAAREKDYAFLDQPYTIQHFPLQFYTLKSRQIKIDQYEDLSGLVVGTVRGSVYYPDFDRDNQLTKVSVTSSQQLLELLMKQRIDTFIEREDSLLPLLRQDNKYQKQIVPNKYMYDKQVDVHLALSKRSFIYQYRDQLSYNLQQFLTNGDIDRVLARTDKKHQADY